MNCSLPGSSVHGVLQARILGWVSMPFSRGSSQLRDQIHIPCISSIIGAFFFCPLSHLGIALGVVQFSSVAQLCQTLSDPMDCSMPGFPVHHQLPELTQIPVHRMGDDIHHSHASVVPFPSCLQSFPASGSLQMSQFFHQLAKVLEFQLQDQSFQ